MRIDELDLPYLAMESDDVAANPWPHLDAVREQHPWLAKCAFGYVVHEYRAIDELLRMGDEMEMAFTDMVVAMNAKDTPWGDWQERHLLSMSGERHQALREVLQSRFSPRHAKQHRGLMREVITQLLDEWAPKGAFDFELFASHFPITVMCNLIGAPPSVVPELHDSLETLGLSASMLTELEPQLQKAYLHLEGFCEDLVQGRRAGKRLHAERDILDELIEVVDAGDMSHREMIDLLVFLFAAGYDTSKNMLTLMMDRLLDNPDDYRKCAKDVDYCRKVMEEVFRLNNSSTIFRHAGQDVTYRDVVIPEGTTLYFLATTAGRDPSEFDRPNEFDPTRSGNTRHLAFGRGPHICLGQFIARAQITEGLHQIAQRLTNPERAGPSGTRPFFGVWGLRGLPIRFTPAKARATEPA